MSRRPSDIAAVIGVINPAVVGIATTTSTWADMRKFDQAMCLYMASATNGTQTLQVLQATDSSGTGSKAITGKTATRTGTDDNMQTVINVEASDLDTDGGFTHVALRVATAGTTNIVGAVILGFQRSPGPASDGDASSVVEIV